MFAAHSLEHLTMSIAGGSRKGNVLFPSRLIKKFKEHPSPWSETITQHLPPSRLSNFSLVTTFKAGGINWQVMFKSLLVLMMEQELF